MNANSSKYILLHILDIMRTTDMYHPKNSTEIIRMISEYGYTCDKRTVQTNIKILQDYGFSILKCKDHNKGWYMGEHGFDLCETKLLLDSLNNIKNLTVEHKNKMKVKLLEVSGKQIREVIPDNLTSSSEYKDDSAFLRNLHAVLMAKYQHKKVKFKYADLDENFEQILRGNGKEYIISVYYIYCSDGRYYIIGQDDKHLNLVTYRLDRIVNLRPIHEEALNPADLLGVHYKQELKHHIDTVVDNYSGQMSLIRVKLHNDPKSINMLYDFIGKSFEIQKEENMLIVDFRMQISPTLVGWFMQNSDRFEICAPEHLKQELVEKAKHIISIY